MDEPRRYGTLEPADLRPEQRAVVDTIVAGGRRDLSQVALGPFEAMLRSPGVAGASLAFGDQVRFKSALPEALIEAAILQTARHWNCEYVWLRHYRHARKHGLDDSVVEAIARGDSVSWWQPGHAVVQFARELLQAGNVADETFAAVRSNWGEAATVDLMGLVAHYCFGCFCINVDRVPVPGTGDDDLLRQQSKWIDSSSR